MTIKLKNDIQNTTSVHNTQHTYDSFNKILTTNNIVIASIKQLILYTEELLKNRSTRYYSEAKNSFTQSVSQSVSQSVTQSVCHSLTLSINH